jgi:hypothetical protein
MPGFSSKPVIITAASAALFLVACGSGGGNQDGGAPDTMAQVTLSYQELMDACVRLSACDVQRQPRVGDCIDNYYLVLDQNGQRGLYSYLYSRVNEAKGDCGKVREVMGFHRRPDDPKLKCESSTYKVRCEGNVAYTCDLIRGREQRLDCTPGGLKCGIKDTGSGSKDAFCGGGNCDGKTFKSYCANNKHYRCNGGGIEINDCGAQGQQCRDPGAGCEGTGVSCKAENDSCIGNIVKRCQNGYRWDADCTKMPGGRQVCDSAQGKCFGKGTQCSSSNSKTWFNYCEGDNLVACIDGFKTLFDCKKLGMLGCKEEVKTTYSLAYCRAEPVYN